KGYASLDYEITGYRATDLVKIDMLLNKEPIDALSFIAHREEAQNRARQMTTMLKKLIPRQNFEVDIQRSEERRVGKKCKYTRSKRDWSSDVCSSDLKGYASLDYEITGYRATDLVKIDMLLNKEPIDALSFIAHREEAQNRARQMTTMLKKLIPRQNFEVDIQ